MPCVLEHAGEQPGILGGVYAVDPVVRTHNGPRLFRRHDLRLFDELRDAWGDDERYVSAVRESSPRMNDLLRADIARLQPQAADSGWDTETRYREMQGVETTKPEEEKA